METINIERMTYGIDSLGHLNGKVVFVPYGAPNDRAEIEIKETKNDFLRGSLTRVVEASPLRRESPCPNFPECGGCHWLHLLPETQLREKEDYLRFILKPLSPGAIYPIEALPMTHYRNKMELKVKVNEDGNVVLGNYKYRSHDVVPLNGCIVQCHENLTILKALNEFFKQPNGAGIAKNIDEIMVRTLKTQQHALIYQKSPPDDITLNAFRDFFNQQESLSRLELVDKESSFLTLVREKPPFAFMKKNWTVSPHSFFQNNLDGAEAIYYTLISIYDNIHSKGRFIDLYCGVGIQTMVLENRFEEVLGVESNEDSFQDALKNLKTRNTSRIRFICRRAETIFGTPMTKGVIAGLHLNPPRTGISQRVGRGLMGIKPRLITYLSCNPMTFKRDALMIMQMGYRLEQVHAFDLFPGTFHLEILGTFIR